MQAVILAGGKGTRLKPYTAVFPKPLMPVGDLPILEIVIQQLAHSGFAEIKMAVGHLAGLLEAYFGNGERWNVRITYSYEHDPLGTAGPLSLIDGLEENFLVMNGDVLTTLEYGKFLNFHKGSGAEVSIAVYERKVPVSLGVLELDEQMRLQDYIEKPTLTYQASMGIYAFNRRALAYIPKQGRLDFPDLIKTLLKNGKHVQGYRFADYWLDIGTPDDYERAISEFEQLKHLFLPGLGG